MIATRHHLHATQVLAALEAGKHIFCEKPLCLSEIELAEIVRAYASRSSGHNRVLMVGFNRRFAPMAIKMKAFLKQVHEPLALHYRVNAGFISRDHWVNDPEQGGGRILGEVCHFVDFLTFLAEALPVEVQARSVTGLESASRTTMSSFRFDLRTDHKARSAIWRTVTDPIPRNAWKCLAEAPWQCWKIFGDWNSCVMAGSKHSIPIPPGQRASRRVGGLCCRGSRSRRISNSV